MTWYPITIAGDDGTPVHATASTQERPDGYMHIWAKFQLPGMRPMQVHAKIELRLVEDELTARVAVPAAVTAADTERGEVGGDVEVGRFRHRLKRRLKKAVRKVAKSKLVKGIVKTVKRAIDNPLVKAALSATPMGAAMYATRAAARVAAKAIKGGKRAKAFVSGVAEAERRGNPQARAAMRLMACGLRQHMPQAAAQLSGDESRQFALIAGWAAPHYPAQVGIGCDRWCAQGEGPETEHEIDALNEFASSGAWEGVRWVASRMGLHSMDARPNELTAKGALLDGRSAQAARFG